MKNKKRTLTIILCICILICASFSLFIKVGRKIAKTPQAKGIYYVSQEKIYFRSIKPYKKVFFIYDTVNKELKKTLKHPDLPVDLRNTKKEESYFLTEKYKYTRCEEYLLRTDILTGEEIAVKLFMQENEKKPVKEYTPLQYYKTMGETVYFKARIDEKEYLCKCDESGYCVVVADCGDIKEFNGNFYFFNTTKTERDTGKTDKKGNVIKETVIEKSLMVYDGKNDLKKLISLDEDFYTIGDLSISDKGIIFIEPDKPNVAKLYSLNGELKTELTLSFEKALFLHKDKYTGVMYYYGEDSFNTPTVVKISSDLSKQEVIWNNELIDSKFDFIFSPVMSGFTIKDSEIYYFVTSSYEGNDAFAFCKTNKKGETEIIYRERKHFLRNFFKSDLR